MGSLYDAVSNVIECEILVNKFEIQSRYYVHFWTKPIVKDMKPLIFEQLVEYPHYKNGFGIK